MMKNDDNIWVDRFLKMIGIITVLRLIVLAIPEITPQGAYYWNYSRHLALGYFDHPPVTAYTIRLFTTIFGNNIFAVRSVALFYSTGYLLFMFLLGRRMYSSKIGFFSALAMAITPLNLIGGTFVTVDPALIFFWIGAVYFFYRAVTDDNPKDFWLTGVFAGLAMLSKYPAIFLFAGFGVYLISTPKGRKQLQTPHPYIAIVISIIMFLPQIIWNYQNDWASFAFQGSHRAGGMKRLRLDYFVGYLLSQLLVASPLFYLGIWFNSFSKIKKALTEDKKILFLLSFSLPMLFTFSAIGLVSWIKINWLAPTYLTAIMLFVVLVFKSGKISKYGKAAYISSAVLTFAIYVIFLFPKIGLSGELMTVSGWRELSAKVYDEQSRLDGSDSSFIFAWRYKVPSVLAFYLPNQPEVYSGDVIGKNTLQYHYWFKNDVDNLIGKNAIFVYDDRWKLKDLTMLDSNFVRVEKAFEFSPKEAGKTITTFHVYRCYGYNPNKSTLLTAAE